MKIISLSTFNKMLCAFAIKNVKVNYTCQTDKFNSMFVRDDTRVLTSLWGWHKIYMDYCYVR